MNCKETMLTKKTVTACNFKAIDHDIYCIDVAHELESIDLEALRDTLIGQFNTKMVSVLDNHAPEKSTYRTVRPRYPWYYNSINDQRRLGRKYERRWRKSRSPEKKRCMLIRKPLLTNSDPTVISDPLHSLLIGKAQH